MDGVMFVCLLGSNLADLLNGRERRRITWRRHPAVRPGDGQQAGAQRTDSKRPLISSWGGVHHFHLPIVADFLRKSNVTANLKSIGVRVVIAILTLAKNTAHFKPTLRLGKTYT